MARPQEDLQKAHQRRKNRESLLETLESIVIAFVLAFIFRAFVVEAFVIPTGSMAATLYGEHGEFRCPDCGYRFAVGVEADARPTEALCPNCFKSQHLAGEPARYSGDRILVLKYLYDFEQPRRWDVIVFHNPNDPSQNYIKRLVGLPGETIELVDGNVTINDRIAQKTDEAQASLWMLVHDTRYKATRQGWEPRWAAASPWQSQDAGFVLDKALGKDKTAWLTYRHRGPGGGIENIKDSYAYNSGSPAYRQGAQVVTDLSLRTEVAAGQPASVVVIEMRAYKDRFRFELTAEGSDQPTRVFLNDKVIARAAGGVLPVGRAVRVQAANVDHKLMLLAGGSRVALEAACETTPEGDLLYEPTRLSEAERDRFDAPSGDEPRAMASEVRIGARGGPASLAYLRLDRDVYYLSKDPSGRELFPGNGIERKPFPVNAGEYFVCGDNSPKSFDSRLWPSHDRPDMRPVVPRRNLVGKAFFIYWPSAGPRYAIPVRVVPDLTGFRFVH